MFQVVSSLVSSGVAAQRIPRYFSVGNLLFNHQKIEFCSFHRPMDPILRTLVVATRNLATVLGRRNAPRVSIVSPKRQLFPAHIFYSRIVDNQGEKNWSCVVFQRPDAWLCLVCVNNRTKVKAMQVGSEADATECGERITGGKERCA